MKSNKIKLNEDNKIVFKEIKLPLGIDLDNCYDIIHNNAPCKAEFNGEVLYSVDSLDDMYLKSTGYSRDEFYNELNLTVNYPSLK